MTKEKNKMLAREMIILIYEFSPNHREMFEPVLKQLVWHREWWRKGKKNTMKMNDWYRVYEMYYESGRMVKLS